LGVKALITFCETGYNLIALSIIHCPLSILITAFTLSLAIMGLWICFNWQGMIFEPLSYSIEGFCYKYGLPHYILKPLWSCPTCMSSFWGAVFYIALGHSYLSIVQMLFILPVTAFINTLFCILLNKITDEGCG
jgi:hypothetical protein